MVRMRKLGGTNYIYYLYEHLKKIMKNFDEFELLQNYYETLMFPIGNSKF